MGIVWGVLVALAYAAMNLCLRAAAVPSTLTATACSDRGERLNRA